LRDARDTYREYSGAAAAAPNGGKPAERDAGTPANARPAQERPHDPPARPARHDDPDVVLDVQQLHVDEIDLKLDELKARVALEAHVLDLLRLDVGVEAELRGVGLQIKGVDAQALLKVRLENLTVLVDRVMSTIDRNPKILEDLTERLGATLEQVGSGAGQAVGTLGQGAGQAVGSLGEGAGEAVRDIGGSAGSAVDEVGKGAGSAAGEVGGIARALAPDAAHPNGDSPK
jgi:hypothetical protein